eukprot:5196624-Lingulodinium_polyedra.AAC.1
MASFVFKKYGEKAACALARLWCDRMQYLYDLWLAADDPRHVFAPAVVHAQTETEVWRAAVDALQGTVAKERARGIELLRPGLKP